MSENQFGTGGMSGGGNPQGYYATPVQPASPFGGAAAQPADPFGAPPSTVGPSPFGGPGYGEGPMAPPARSKAKPIILGVVVLLLIIGGWFGYRVYQHSRPVTLPATLGGLPVSTLPSIQSAVDSAQKQMQQQNPGTQLQFKAYGSDATRILIAAAARGRTNVDQDIRTFGNNIGATSQVGNSTCATSAADHVTVCESSDSDLTVLVASVTRDPAASEASVAALVDEIRSQV